MFHVGEWMCDWNKCVQLFNRKLTPRPNSESLLTHHKPVAPQTIRLFRTNTHCSASEQMNIHSFSKFNLTNQTQFSENNMPEKIATENQFSRWIKFITDQYDWSISEWISRASAVLNIKTRKEVNIHIWNWHIQSFVLYEHYGINLTNSINRIKSGRDTCFSASQLSRLSQNSFSISVQVIQNVMLILCISVPRYYFVKIK